VDRVRLQSDAATPVVSHEQTTTWDNLERLLTVSNTLGTHTMSYLGLSNLPLTISGPNTVVTDFQYTNPNDPGDAARRVSRGARNKIS